MNMSGFPLRRDILRIFKQLHNTRKKVFREDIVALSAARQKINEEFKKNKNVSDQTAIHEMMTFAEAVEKELRTTVIQAKEIAPNKYELRITEDTVKLDNVPPSSTCTNQEVELDIPLCSSTKQDSIPPSNATEEQSPLSRRSQPPR